MIPRVNEFVRGRRIFQRVQLSRFLRRKNQMYGIRCMESQDYTVTFTFYCVLQCLLLVRFENRTNQNDGYCYPIMRDVLFSPLLFFLPFSFLPSPLFLLGRIEPGSRMRLLCPRFLSFMLDSRRDVQRSCYNVAG